MKKGYISRDKILYTLLSFISLGILLKTYHYLNQLEKCQCYRDVQAYNTLKIDIDFLKAYQIFEMFLIIMFIVILIFCSSAKIGSHNKPFSLTFLSSSVILLLTFVTGYISYNVFLLYFFSTARCECIDKWQKYFIYVQGIMGTISFMRLLFLFMFVLLLSLSTNYS